MASGTIKSVVPRSHIVDNLTTNDSTKVLSAAQGYALNSKLANKQDTSVTNVVLYKTGNVVQVNIAIDDITIGDWTTIRTLPEGYRPLRIIHIGYGSGQIIIATNGSIESSTPLTNAHIYINTCYVTE